MKINIEPTPEGDYLIKLSSDDSDAFMAAIRGLKDCIDPSCRRWQPASKSWRIIPEGQLFVADWLAVCRDHFNAEVSWTKPKGEKRSSAWPPPKQEADPFKELFLLPTAPVEVVKAAYKALATIHHPDKGGDVSQMQRINAAYSELSMRLKAA